MARVFPVRADLRPPGSPDIEDSIVLSARVTVVVTTVKELISKARPPDRWIALTLKSLLTAKSSSTWLDSTLGRRASGINLMIPDPICLRECCPSEEMQFGLSKGFRFSV